MRFLGFKRPLLFTALLTPLLLPTIGSASAKPLSAEASDPKVMGWMQGFPPAPDKLVMQPQSNFFTFPRLRWTVCHMQELMPSQPISRGLGAPTPLDYQLDPKIDDISFQPLGSKDTMSWKESLAANYTDAMLVIHKGKIVYEHFGGCLDELGKHATMSMTKSLTGLIAEVLIAEGKLDETALVASIIPELKGSAFGNATVRQVMDMTTGLQFSEDYANPKADIWVYSAAANPLPKPAGYQGPIGYYDYLKTVRPKGQHGEAFGYKTINTDVLGWLIARASGQSVTQAISERLWQKLGMEQGAYMLVDAKGTPFAGGGLSAGLRDLGRIGLMMLNNGNFNGEQIIPEAAVNSIAQGGDKAAFAKAGYTTLPGGSYRGMWWHLHNDNGAYAARGVHGQTIYIDPKAEAVIVRLASHPIASNAKIDPTSLPAYQALSDYLISKP